MKIVNVKLAKVKSKDFIGDIDIINVDKGLLLVDEYNVMPHELRKALYLLTKMDAERTECNRIRTLLSDRGR